MRFAVIENREWTASSEPSRPQGDVVDVMDVEAEARRRKMLLGIDEWQVREYVTGVPIPAEIRHTCLQIDYAAQALTRLSPIPHDFYDDLYWPRSW